VVGGDMGQDGKERDRVV